MSSTESSPLHERWSEAPAWAASGSAWQPLGGSFHGEGFSVEWHGLGTNDRVKWADTFHPHSVEICLNIRGRAKLGCSGDGIAVDEGTTVFYVRGDDPISASRSPGERR